MKQISDMLYSWWTILPSRTKPPRRNLDLEGLEEYLFVGFWVGVCTMVVSGLFVFGSEERERDR
jgi:hypothetical protein